MEEIRELVTFDQRGLDRCRRVHALIQAKLTQIEVHMADLRTLKRSLLGSLQSCEDTLLAHGEECPLGEDDGTARRGPVRRPRGRTVKSR